MTGYGFCGPMTAMGTTIDDKAEAASVVGYYAAWQSSVIQATAVDVWILWILCP